MTELSALKNMLNDDRKTMELVLSVNGALRGLIRELTGDNITFSLGSRGIAKVSSTLKFYHSPNLSVQNVCPYFKMKCIIPS